MAKSDVSAVTRYFSTINEGFVTTVAGSGVVANGAVIPITNTSGLVNGSVFTGIVEPGATNQQTFTGTVDTTGSQLTGVKWTRGQNVDHLAGATIVDYITGTDFNMMSTGIRKQHNDDGSHKNVTTDTLTVSNSMSLLGGFAAPAKSIDGSTIKDNSIVPLANKQTYAVRAYMAQDLVTAANTWTTCSLSLEYALGFVQNGSGGLIVPVTGLYQVNITVTHQDNPSGPGGAAHVIAGMAVSRTTAAPSQPGWFQRTGFAINPQSICMARVYLLSQGDHVYLQTYAAASTNNNYRCRSGNGSDPTTMELVYLGPSA